MDKTTVKIWNPLIQDSKADWIECNKETKENISRHIAQLLQSEFL